MQRRIVSKHELSKDDEFNSHLTATDTVEEIEKPHKIKLVWSNIIFLGSLHIASVYGAYLSITSTKLATILFTIFLYYFSGIGITAGVHRLWSHRSYKAKWPLRLLLALMNTVAWQYSIITWARDHRMHHKYSDTNADPYSAERGFFFSHIGWLMCTKHPDIKTKGKGIDLSDLYNDPVVMLQKRYYKLLVSIFCIYLPSAIPVYFWNESWKNGFFICFILRYILVSNGMFLINSAAHLYGMRPYDKNIYPRQNALVSFLTLGEGWHNYHHTFPWDYKAAEFGNGLNGASLFIDFFAKIGWAYDLKTVKTDMIRKRAQRTGDGSPLIQESFLVLS